MTITLYGTLLTLTTMSLFMTGINLIGVVSGDVVTTIAGSRISGFADGLPTQAQFNWPDRVVVDPRHHNMLLVADSNNNRLRRIETMGNGTAINVSTIAGTGNFSAIDGLPLAATFCGPYIITFDPQNSNTLYVGDANNHKIRKIEMSANGTATRVSTVAGSGTNGFADGIPLQAMFSYPWCVVVDPNNNGSLYVADRSNNRIRKILLAPDGSALSVGTIAGNGNAGWADGAPMQAMLSGPNGIAVGPHDNTTMYVADTDNHRIRKIVLAVNGTALNISTIAGTGAAGFADGSPLQAKFNSPYDVAIDPRNRSMVYIADRYGNRIRKLIVSSTGTSLVVGTLAGTGTGGYADGPPAQAMFNLPWGITVDPSNSSILYVGDSGNHCIRRIDLTPARSHYSSLTGDLQSASTTIPASLTTSASATGSASSTVTASPTINSTSDSLSHSLVLSASVPNSSASQSLLTTESPSTVVTATSSPGTYKLTTSSTLSRRQTRHTLSPTLSAGMRTWSHSSSTSQGNSACDDVPWFVHLVEPQSLSSSFASRMISVGYDWFASNRSGALVVEIANLSPWRCVGAHLVIGGEELAFEVADVDVRAGGNATVRLSPSVNSTALLDGGSVVWPGVLRLPFADQHVEIALEMSCSAVLFSASISLAVKGLPPPTVSATAQSVVGGSQAVSVISASPTSAATMARVSSAMSLTSCVKAIDNSAVSQSADKVRALMPIEFYNSSSPNDDIVNSLLANDVFIASFAGVIAVVGLGVSLFAGMSFQDVLLQLRWPSTLFPAFVATLPSVVGSVGAFVIRAADGSTLEAGDWAPCLLTCCSGVVLWLGFCVWVTVVCVRGSSLMVSHEKTTKYLFVDQLLRCERTWVRSMLRFVFRSDWEWAARKDGKAKNEKDAQSIDENMSGDHHRDQSGEFAAFVQANSSAFTELRVSWFTAFDVWTTLLSSVVNVIPLGTTVGCVSVAVANVVIALIVCVVAVVIRPYGSRFGTVHLMLTQLGSLSCTCCVLAYIVTAHEEILSALSTVVIVIGALSMSRTMVDLAVLVETAIKLRVVVVAHRHAAREKRSAEHVEKQHPEWSFGGLFDEFDEQLDEKRTLSEEYDTEGNFFHKEVSVGESLFWDSSGNVAPDVLRQGGDTFSLLLDNWDEGTTTRIPGTQEAALVGSIDELDIDELLGIRRDVEVEAM